MKDHDWDGPLTPYTQVGQYICKICGYRARSFLGGLPTPLGDGTEKFGHGGNGDCDEEMVRKTLDE